MKNKSSKPFDFLFSYPFTLFSQQSKQNHKKQEARSRSTYMEDHTHGYFSKKCFFALCIALGSHPIRFHIVVLLISFSCVFRPCILGIHFQRRSKKDSKFLFVGRENKCKEKKIKKLNDIFR